MDIQTFDELGFTRNESRIYLLLVERGRLPALSIAKLFELPRSTVYSALDSLNNRGLVVPEKLRGRTVFRAREPECIEKEFEDRSRLIQEQQILAKSLVQDLKKKFRGIPSHSPELEYVEGKRKVERFLDENLHRWKDSILAMPSRSTWGFQDPSFVEAFPKWLEKAWQVLHSESRIEGRILSSRSQTEGKLKGKISRREVRVLGESFSFESSMWVMGDYVVLIMTRKNPNYAFQLRDSLLAKNLQLLFHFLYSQASRHPELHELKGSRARSDR